MSKFHLLTLGCQMNKNDSERIAGLLLSLGLSAAGRAEEADVIVLNTCSVRDSAEDRVYGFTDYWVGLKKQKPNLIIAVTGCMPGRDRDGKLRKKLRSVDLFFPIDELPLLPGRLRGLNQKEFGGFDAGQEDDYLKIVPRRANNFQAYITIQTGCNNFCTYCVVPYARGREKNRPVAEIIAEVRRAAESGVKEITLLGQTVNSYQAPDPDNFSSLNPFKYPLSLRGATQERRSNLPDLLGTESKGIATAPHRRFAMTQAGDDFAALLWEVNQISGIKRIHFTAADPQYFNDFQIQALGLPKQVNFLHLPAQSGDNEILRKMNRQYTREHYIDLVEKIRQIHPDIALGTDLIVGFPGETEKQFQNTLDLYRQCDFDIAYQAKYSERSGTAAAKAFRDDVSDKEKKRRWEAVQDLMEQTVLRKNQKYQDKIVEVLVDSMSKGKCSGNTREMKLCQFAGTSDLIGQIVSVKITDPQMWVLRGERI